MKKLIDPGDSAIKTQQKSQFSESGIYVREDDQDWGSAGMDNISEESSKSQ